MELVKRNLCRSKHKYELKLKNKRHQRIKNTADSNHTFRPKSRDKISQTNYYYDLMTFWKNMTRQNTYRFRN